jgi:phosphohistidine phosphatase
VSYLLYLMRHAIAEPRGQTADVDRPLADEGVRGMHRIALGLKRLGIVPDLILTSPMRRAEETAGILLPVLAPDLPIEIYPPLAPGNPVHEMIGGLRAYRRAHHVVLVGHQPDWANSPRNCSPARLRCCRCLSRKGAPPPSKSRPSHPAPPVGSIGS